MTGEFAWKLEAGLVKNENRAETLDRELLALFEQFSNGDQEMLGAIYDLCALRIFGLALWQTGSREDASDIVQEVFLRIASRAGQLRSIEKPFQYLLRITHTITCDLWRRRKRDSKLQDPLLEPAWNDTGDSGIEMDLSSLLYQLPPKQRETLYLHYYCDLSLREIATVSGVSIFTAASRCRLGIARLKKRLGVKE